jgi:hypothetical protein
MIRILLYISVCTLLSCNSRTKLSDKKPSNETGPHVEVPSNTPTIHKIDNSKCYTTLDTLIIPTEIGDTLKYAQNEFNKIIDDHPELVSDYTQNPDETYQCNGEKGAFNSEVGKDGYFMLYAYFLKNKNGDKPNSERRKKLISIFSNINSLFSHFEYGGTYFGHQYARILGYAEYSIYLYKQNEKYGNSKTYDITKQKALYIQSLRQLISDESTIDFNVLGKKKVERTRQLNKIVDEIDKAITDNFYFRRTQDFHYGHY